MSDHSLTITMAGPILALGDKPKRSGTGDTAGMSSSAGGNDLPPHAGTVADVGRMVEQLNELARQQKRSLHFRVDDVSGRTIITVVNPETAEIVRQIPSEELLAVARSLDALGAVLSAYA